MTMRHQPTELLRPSLITPRLRLRGWHVADAPDALAIYQHESVTRWLSPAMARVPDRTEMRRLLRQWIGDTACLDVPAGHWALERRSDGRVIGGASVLPLPPGNDDLEIGWQLHPDFWGLGYAGEAAFALAGWAFEHDVDELYAVVRPDNTRAAASVRRNGMQWVGETDKYFGMTLQVFRLRPADLERAAPLGQLPPAYQDD
ncbi:MULTISPECIES: GNAT family N-acetyltransferase [Prauserella salsuginis group]|uniref:RimJ/RimL family protein N-acetyltransferase n=2 Tax=Prauserella salsuginis group TaxID=2893672 RepID=A0A839XUE9_9PSEU|nr:MULTISPECIES: GNAT family N-acetyltransferase [Prauserella salsuginis group]MBB3663636.1 RimJ/RimL family protein N-acetyltransferase [Prauserella sediminis]